LLRHLEQKGVEADKRVLGEAFPLGQIDCARAPRPCGSLPSGVSPVR
jgi:hypothetical protein